MTPRGAGTKIFVPGGGGGPLTWLVPESSRAKLPELCGWAATGAGDAERADAERCATSAAWCGCPDAERSAGWAEPDRSVLGGCGDTRPPSSAAGVGAAASDGFAPLLSFFGLNSLLKNDGMMTANKRWSPIDCADGAMNSDM